MVVNYSIGDEQQGIMTTFIVLLSGEDARKYEFQRYQSNHKEWETTAFPSASDGYLHL